MPPLQCLFCHHTNPATASFCNDCGSQLNLQPCTQCGAVDNRTAKNCHKCGAGFDTPAEPQRISAPTIAGNSSVNYVNFARKPSSSHPSLAELPQVYNISSSERSSASSMLRRGWGIAVSTLVLALMAAVSVYAYFRPSAPGLKQPVVMQAATRLAGGSISTIPPAPVVAAKVETAKVKSPSRASDEAVKNHQDPLLLKECPPAVAALGLCDPITK